MTKATRDLRTRGADAEFDRICREATEAGETVVVGTDPNLVRLSDAMGPRPKPSRRKAKPRRKGGRR